MVTLTLHSVIPVSEIHKRQHTVQEQGPQHDMHSVIGGKKTPKPNKVKTEDPRQKEH